MSTNTNPYAGMSYEERRVFNEYRITRLSIQSIVLVFLTLVILSTGYCAQREYITARFCIEKANTSAEFRACRLSETTSTINEHK